MRTAIDSTQVAHPLTEKQAHHAAFWRGEGPSLILIPAEELVQYDVAHYAERFANPRLMWDAEMRRARPLLDWPTDGIPTVRPNLGTIFVPSLAGQEVILHEGQMPWRGGELTRREILLASERPLATATLMQRALEFYAIHHASGETEIAAYHPDTQGVFDIAHLLVGDQIFYDLCGDDEVWIGELLRICCELYVNATVMVKQAIGEERGLMIHGHGTPQGVYFPHAGTRISEDTLVLLRMPMIREFVMPTLRRSMEEFGGAFAHYCGRREDLFTLLCEEPLVRAIDLGNPEMYDLEFILGECGRTGKVLYSRLPARPGEQWDEYIKRIASGVRTTGARVILRPTVYPAGRAECAEMLNAWHALTERKA